MSGWWKLWCQRRHEEPTVQRAFELREFVYLDEVSVISLLSWRLGKLPSEFTDTLTDATKEELNSKIEANAAVLKSSIGSRIESSRTEDTKVLSKATIQATFKKLYDGEEDRLALKPVLSIEPPPVIEKARRALAPNTGDEELKPWRVESEQLKRGQLVEMEVELQADATFRLSTILTTFAELANESKELLAQANQQGFEKAIELNRVLDKLMAGLIPLKCRVVDYTVVTLGQQEYLMHRRVIEQLPEVEKPPVKDLYLVGVAEQSLFWKDIRRVLFSGARFRVLCRLNHGGLDSSWTPVKLVDVLGEVVPDLKRQMGIFGHGALRAMMASTAVHGKFIEPRLRALTTFGELLAQQLEVELDDNDREHIENLASEAANLVTSVAESRKAFTQLAEFFAARTLKDIDPVVVSRLRVQACKQHDLLPGGSAVRTEAIVPPEVVNESDERFIDAEIIAIYW
jgi:hypothetical protein